MMDFKEFLYDYLSENAYPVLICNETYQNALAERNLAEENLFATLNNEQRALLDEFVGRLLNLCDLEAHYYFSEAFRIVGSLLTA